MRYRIPSVLAVCAVLAMTIAGCSSAEADAPGQEVATKAAGSIENCGVTVDVGAPPKRIVTIKSSATELALALGLEKRIVGTAFLDGPIPKSFTDHGTPPLITDALPSEEAVLALKPDFIYAGWESNFSAEGVGTRDALATLGIGTYVSPSACKEKASMPDPLTFDTVFAEIEQAGRIFGVEKKANQLVSAQKAQLKALTPPKHPVTAVWYSSGSTTPYVGAGIGAPNMIMKAAGLKNIESDIHDTWSSVSWEAIAADNPDVMVLVDSDWNSADKKKALLQSNPVTKQLDAVIHHRFIVVPFAATEAGVRNVQATASIIKQLKKLDR